MAYTGSFMSSCGEKQPKVRLASCSRQAEMHVVPFHELKRFQNFGMLFSGILSLILTQLNHPRVIESVLGSTPVEHPHNTHGNLPNYYSEI